MHFITIPKYPHITLFWNVYWFRSRLSFCWYREVPALYSLLPYIIQQQYILSFSNDSARFQLECEFNSHMPGVSSALTLSRFCWGLFPIFFRISELLYSALSDVSDFFFDNSDSIIERVSIYLWTLHLYRRKEPIMTIKLRSLIEIKVKKHYKIVF